MTVAVRAEAPVAAVGSAEAVQRGPAHRWAGQELEEAGALEAWASLVLSVAVSSVSL